MVAFGIAAALSLPGAWATSTCAPAGIPHVSRAPAAPSRTPKQQLVFLDPARYPKALCNDGTPAAYWFRPGYDDGATRWVFYLEGGRKCLNNFDCSVRRATTPKLTSSTGLTNMKMQGLLSADAGTNPTFYNANVVKVHYCSSDYWIGDFLPDVRFDPNDAQDTWNFQGREIALSVLEDLMPRGAGAATEVLLAGSAAGGIGITDIANDLIPHLPSSARILLLNDAGYSIDVAGYDPNGSPPNYTSDASPTPGEATLEAGRALWRGHGDRACIAASPERPIGCMSSAFVVGGGWIPVPVLDMESQLDHAQLADDGWFGSLQQGTPSDGYATWWAGQMAASLTDSGSMNSVFSPYKLMHSMVDKDRTFNKDYTFPDGPMTPQQAVAQWYAAPCTRLVKLGAGTQ